MEPITEASNPITADIDLADSAGNNLLGRLRSSNYEYTLSRNSCITEPV